MSEVLVASSGRASRYARAAARQTFSTKSFVPGHVAGAAILLFGTIAITKAFLARREASLHPAGQVAENDRGQYGRKP